MAIVAAYVICPLICFPLYLTTEVLQKNVTLGLNDGYITSNASYNQSYGSGDDEVVEVTNVTLYYVALTKSAQSGLFEMNFWIYSVVIKLIPCVALTILSLRLIMALVEAKKRRKKLTTTTMLKMEETINLAESKKRKRKASRIIDKEKQTDRTTKMLLAVLLLFLLTEFSQGTMGLLSVVLGANFFNTCYVKLGICLLFSFLFFFACVCEVKFRTFNFV